ncbi:MAG: serine/threonine protein kinase [Planctomycetes bacterium]|nr:serine/threonine protein kinase [Planctomycetota bacterium]
MPDPNEPEFKSVEEKTLLEIGSDSQAQHLKPGPTIPPGAKRLGQVALLAELGTGGMGKVFKGHHLGLDKPVAVKVMGHQLAGDSMAKARFLREARTAAKLDHSGIVRVLDVNEEGGVPYIVMEYIEGTDLAALLKQHGALDGMATLRAVAQVADGLANAHAEGIVHRDIKPHNIFAAKDGRVKLGDFGLARAVEQVTELTMPGAAIGTAYYMSPEQAQGKDVDQRSDIYSLGVTAWHLLTGQTPYTGTTPVSIAVQHVNNDIPYERERFGHLPDPVVYLLISMTARDPARRPTAQAVHDQLVQILAQATGNGSPRLNSLDDLLQHGKASQFVQRPQTLTMPLAPPPHMGTPAPQALPPVFPHNFAPPQKSGNNLLWIAIALLVFFVLLFAGCMAVVLGG